MIENTIQEQEVGAFKDYSFFCSCGQWHKLSFYAVAQLSSGNDLNYTCQLKKDLPKVELIAGNFK